MQQRININLKIISLLICLILTTGCSSQSPVPQSGIYGNWCGAGYPEDIHNAREPVDALDATCKKHDFCYADKGYLNCDCDKGLNEELALGLTENQYQGSQIVFVRSFRTYFQASPCVGDHSSKVGPSRAVHNIIKNVGKKTMQVIDLLPFVNTNSEDTEEESDIDASSPE